ncbi:histidine phosphatase family protein [Paenibacillus tarimensis]
MQTTVYFVRHALSDITIKDETNRPLTLRGIEDSKRVTRALRERDISVIFSSPFQRTVHTLKDLSECLGLDIITHDDFRERRVGEWVEDFRAFSRRQWEDFDYKLNGGESLREVQQRNIKKLFEVLNLNQGKNIIIGTHGTALSTIVNYFDTGFVYDDFWDMIDKMPYILEFRFEGMGLRSLEEVELE